LRSLGSYKNEVTLSQRELDLIDASVASGCFHVTQERRESIADAGFVADGVFSNLPRDLTVVS